MLSSAFRITAASILNKMVEDSDLFLFGDDLSPVYTTTFLARYPFEFGPGA